MATGNPTGGDGIVALDLPDHQRRYLRGAFSDCKAGREDDLQPTRTIPTPTAGVPTPPHTGASSQASTPGRSSPMPRSGA